MGVANERLSTLLCTRSTFSFGAGTASPASPPTSAPTTIPTHSRPVPNRDAIVQPIAVSPTAITTGMTAAPRMTSGSPKNTPILVSTMR